MSPHPATETLQLYIRDLVASVTRPIQELRGFQRISLAAAESQFVTFTLTGSDLSFPGKDLLPVIEPGEFLVMIGSSSADWRSAKFTYFS
ncbi:MAG: hypothetical protein HC845_14175 [Akkermansiaceae bacterium]|nr:hypothetical protein [Akkermansiaceae bacterium]